MTSGPRPLRGYDVRVALYGEATYLLRDMTALRLDTVGEEIWRRCDGTASVAHIAADIARAYGQPEAEVAEDVSQFLGRVAEAGFLAREEAQYVAPQRDAAADLARWRGIGAEIAAEYPGVVTAFLSGSLVEGIGNSSSDLDLFVVVKHDPRRPDDGQEFAGDVRIDDGLRVDTEIWPLERVQKIAWAISECDLADPKAVMRFPQGWAAFAHRLRVGVPVDGPGELDGIRDAFDWSRLCGIQARRHLLCYNNAAEDVAGAMRQRDAGVALLTSRWALGSAADALLYARGITTTSEKWRFRRIAKCPQPGPLTEYAAFERDGDGDLFSRCEERLRYASRLAHEAITQLAHGQD
ncbi:PqqD family peptide modification chaperone [Streptomyces sp. NPDC046994]|uniref:PqqD family peptide modification chaperone n=1 Tax=Streptomyces sp. NPDC046994 TaxID=3155735 RepID=UPI0034515B01